MKKSDIVCPRCFSVHPKTELAWGCANPDCPREGIPTTSSVPNPNCSDCNSTLTLRFCPDCGFQINLGSDYTESLPISVIGSESSGKSNYLTVLINEVRNTVGKIYNCSLYPVGGDDTIVQYESLYYKPLYEEGICLPSTNQEDVRPLVYSLVFDSPSYGKTCSVTFYDACGSNFRNERVMADYNRSIYNSRGIILLLDPSQLPGIREEYLAAGVPVLEDDFSSVLARTIKVVRKGTNQKSLNQKIKIPIAICLSKLDTLKPRLDPANYLSYPSRHLQQPFYDLIDHNCCNEEVRSLIESWSGSDFINQVQSQFSNFAFFAFSALGSEPEQDNTINHVLPQRVCDPFLWIMQQGRIIKAKAVTPAKK